MLREEEEEEEERPPVATGRDDAGRIAAQARRGHETVSSRCSRRALTVAEPTCVHMAGAPAQTLEDPPSLPAAAGMDWTRHTSHVTRIMRPSVEHGTGTGALAARLMFQHSLRVSRGGGRWRSRVACTSLNLAFQLLRTGGAARPASAAPGSPQASWPGCARGRVEEHARRAHLRGREASSGRAAHEDV